MNVERCRHDMVREFCAPCKGTDDPEIVPTDVVDTQEHVGVYAVAGGGVAPVWFRRDQAATCRSCGELIPKDDPLGECCSE